MSTLALEKEAAFARSTESDGAVRYHGGSAGFAMADAIGPNLTKYEILKPLSTGGMGQVYLAEDTTLRRKVAVKVLSPEWTEDPERFQRFQREARVLATLNHPNIVTIHSVEEEDGAHFLTMELVEGDTLAKLIPSVGFTLDRIFEIAVPLANALAAAHEQGIIHRDLKPGNIMVSKKGLVKVLDFGLAKREDGGAGSVDLDRTEGPPTALRPDSGSAEALGPEPLTQQGLMLGTVPYMAPEQLHGEAVDARADIFSLGIILYEMSTGRRPFDGKTWSDLASSILRDQPPSVTSFNMYLPRHLGRIIRHCLEKDPDRRFQTVLDLRNELEELQREVQSGELPINRSDLSSVIVQRPAVHQDRAVAIGATAVVVAALLLLVWFRAGSRDPDPLPIVGGASGTEFIVPGVEVPPDAAPRAGSYFDPARAAPARPSSNFSGANPAAGSSFRSADSRSAPGPGAVAPRAVLDPAGEREESLRIAVLPMENLGPADQEYFAAGVTEEITSRLAAVRALHVISRTTARNYDRSDKSVQQIGKELGIDYLLTGSVRWSTDSAGQNRVRVTPRLVRVADDSQKWSDNYDRVLDDIFAVQSEIAGEVIGQLGIAILETEQKILVARPTEDFEAYQAYHRGMDYLTRHEATPENLVQAEAALKRATELDPTFALAFAELSEAHSQIYHSLVDRTDARVRMARVAADRALELDPQLAAGHRALGYYYYWGHGDYEAALREFAIAARALPNDSQLLEGLAYIRRRQGRLTEATDQLQRALELDPQSGRLAYALAHTYTVSRRYELADRTYDLAISLTPNEPTPYQRKALNFLLWRGSVEEARATLGIMPRQERLDSLMVWYRLELLSGDYQAALEHVESAPLTLLGTESMVFPRSLLRAQLNALLGRAVDSELLFQGALVVMENLVKQRADDPRVRSALGLVYAGLGRHREAIREGRLAVRLTPVSEDTMKGWVFMEQLAAIYAACGEADSALDLLEELLGMPAEISASLLQLDPRWEPLREHPKFAALVDLASLTS